jgi:tripartite-type tricarboxylate transporter receptor subunit TctC
MKQIAALVLALAAVIAAPAHAQDAFPTKPIRLVVPYPPGALTDLLGRAIADRLAKGLGQPVVVENKPGAGTLLGAEAVAKATPDGYTLLMATSTTLGISPAIYRTPAIDAARDFAPVSQAGAVNFFLIASPGFPAKDFRGMVDVLRGSPGRFNYASVGSGSPHHLFMEILKKDLGLDIQHVPYKGTLAALPDLFGDKVHVMFADATAAVPNIKAGKVNALGTSAARPTTLIPGVPPIAASVPGFDWQAWQGVVAPAGTPPPVIARLSQEMQQFQQTEEWKQLLVKFGMEPSPPHTPAQFGEIIRADVGRWAAAVKAAGAKVE